MACVECVSVRSLCNSLKESKVGRKGGGGVRNTLHGRYSTNIHLFFWSETLVSRFPLLVRENPGNEAVPSALPALPD